MRLTVASSCRTEFHDTPLEYRIGLPAPGLWREIFNSDSRFYGGSDCGNGGTIAATDTAWMGHSSSAPITLPPLAAIILQSRGDTTPPGMQTGD